MLLKLLSREIEKEDVIMAQEKPSIPPQHQEHQPGSEAEENASLRQGVSEIGAAIVRLAQKTGDVPPNLAAPEDEAHDASLEMTNETGT